jgi:competence protein ComEC
LSEISGSGLTRLAPLSLPQANPALKRIRRPARPEPPGQPAALVPLFYAALLFLAGIVVTHSLYLRPSYLLAGLFPLAVVAVFCLRKAPRLTWLPIAAIWLTLGAWAGETEPAPAPDPALARLSDGLLRTVEGTVADAGPMRNRELAGEGLEDREPESLPEARGEQTQRVDLQLAFAELVTDGSDFMMPIPQEANAKLRLSVVWPTHAAARIRCGQRLRAVVRILPPDTFHDPGVWSRATYLESQEITASASVMAAKNDGREPRLMMLDSTGKNSAACLLNQARNFASARLASLPYLTRSLPRMFRASPEDAAMLTALLTGDRTYLTRGLRVGFERTGSFHLIVVSGLHLAILAGCVFALARRIRLTRPAATALTLTISLAYALFTGFAIPVQRSFWMVTLYLLGRLVYRNRSPLNVIGFAALCLAAVSPRSIFEASLQMTLLSVAAIAGIAVPLLERTLHARIQATRDLRLISLDPKLPPKIAQFRVTLRLIARHLETAASQAIAWRILPLVIRSAFRLGELLFVTVAVELALALPMAAYFHRITVYALPVNLLILPLLGILAPAAMLLLLVLSLAGLTGLTSFGTAASLVALAPAAFCLSILHLSVFLVRRLGALALGDLRIPEPSALQAGVAILFFVLALQLARGRAWQRRLAFLSLLLAAVAAIWPRPVDHPRDALFFEAIDVGQGDSLLLIGPDGKTLLVDGGGLGFISPASHVAPSDFDVGEEVVSEALWSRGIRRLDAVALTHAHHDHMGGLPAIVRNFHPRELWIGNNPPVPAYRELLQEAGNLGVGIRRFQAGDRFSLGEMDFRVLAPAAGYHPGLQPANNDSLVFQARYRATSILLAGDAEAPEEQTILSQPDLQSTLLKVGHHGSLTSTRPAFLAAVQPEWAVISCGRRNRFGHPRPEILAELQTAHTRTFRTDVDGAACFVLDGQLVAPDPMCRWRY